MECVSHSVVSDLYLTSQTVAHQSPLSLEFSRQEYTGVGSHSLLGDLPNTGNEPRSPTLQADSLPSGSPGKLQLYNGIQHKWGETDIWYNMDEP